MNFPQFFFKQFSRSDARYVKTLHTNAGSAIYNGLGTNLKVLKSISQKNPNSTYQFMNYFMNNFNDQLGHVDIFINGGSRQPGCTYRRLNYDDFYPRNTTKYRIIDKVFDYFVVCNHYKAIENFIENQMEILKKHTCEKIAYRCPNYKKFLAGMIQKTKLKSNNYLNYYNDSINTDLDLPLLGECGSCGFKNKRCITATYIDDFASFEETFRSNKNQLPFFVLTGNDNHSCGMN